MTELTHSLIHSIADYYYDQLARHLRHALEKMEPSGNREGFANLYAEYRADFKVDASDLAREAWISTLHGLLGPMLATVAPPIRDALYIATQNGGNETLL